MTFPNFPIKVEVKTFPQFCTTLGVGGILFVFAMVWHLDSTSHRTAVASQLTMTAMGSETRQRLELAHQLVAAKGVSQKRQISSELQLESGSLSKLEYKNRVAMGNSDVAMYDLTSFLRLANQTKYWLVAFFSVGLASWSFQASREIFGQPIREHVGQVAFPGKSRTGSNPCRTKGRGRR